jgi:hypothetical protein
MLLATFLAIGVFSVAFLLRFLFALESELRLASRRAARTSRIYSHRIPLAFEVPNKRTIGLTVAYSNPMLAHRLRQSSSGATLVVNESSRAKKEA